MEKLYDIKNIESELKLIYKKAKNIDKNIQNEHLNKIIFFTNLFRILGIFTMWYSVNIFTVICLSLYIVAQWTIIAHHSCHGGYDSINKYHNRFSFALKNRRYFDWFDWILPEAWNYEHNNKHHYNLGEKNEDPDLLEDNMEFIRKSNMPMIFKYLIVFIIALTWRWLYYPSNSYKEYIIKQYEQQNNIIVKDGKQICMIYTPLLNKNYWFSFTNFITNVIGPYFIYNFILLPLPLLVFSKIYFYNALLNLILAELLANIHTFFIIATNHSGNDVYRFSTNCDLTNKGEFYIRQILGSVNYNNGNDFIDYLHGFLNYQIEHHVFPDLSMYAYQQIAPDVKKICNKYNIQYIQENVFIRVYKTIQMMVGNSNMKII